MGLLRFGRRKCHIMPRLSLYYQFSHFLQWFIWEIRAKIVCSYAIHQESISGISEAIRIIEQCQAIKDDLDLSILLASLLHQRSTGNDLDIALSVVLPWSQNISNSIPISQRYELLHLISTLFIALNRSSEAIALVNNISDTIFPPNSKKLLLITIQINTKLRFLFSRTRSRMVFPAVK